MTENSRAVSGRNHLLQEQKPERLVLSPAMMVEQVDGQGATIYLQDDGTRLRIPQALFNLLFLFEKPATIETALGAHAGNAGAVRAIDSLKEKGFLLIESALARTRPVRKRPTTDVPTGLFDCPPRKFSETGDDVVFLGVPYDLGDKNAAGSRHGPAQLRETSLQILYGLERKTGRPRGWFDADRECPIGKGVSLGDYGDIFVEYGEPQCVTFARITDTLSGAIADGALPVLVGGDMTISLPAIKLVQAQGDTAILHISRFRPNRTFKKDHTPEPDRVPGEDGFVTPSTLSRQCQALPNISQFIQIAPFDDGAELSSTYIPDHALCRTKDLITDGRAFLDRTVPEQKKVFLCLDINALALPSGRTGFHYRHLHEFLIFTGTTYTIAGIAITGLNPGQDQWHVMAMIALNLLLTVIDSPTAGKVCHA